ncbi:MAG: FAD-linked oxidase C-terminal domain-containing protein, partial [Gemmatimonadales bacterium]
DRISAIRDRLDLQISNVFHAGDGNLHPCISFDRRDAGMTERVRLASQEIMTACLAAGGSLTGEHGVGSDKRDYMTDAFSADTLDAMCDVRRVFDPEARANPGKVFPTHLCREWRRGVTA